MGEGTVIDLSKHGWKATVTSTLSVQQGTYLKLRLSLPDQAPSMDVKLAAVGGQRDGNSGSNSS